MPSLREFFAHRRATLGERALRVYVRLNRRKLNYHALARITSYGGRVDVSNTSSDDVIPILHGCNDQQLFDTRARARVSLPNLTVDELRELRPYLLSLRNLERVQPLTPITNRP